MTALRLGTAFGAGLRPNSVFRIFIDRARAGEPITIQGDGSQGRQFTYATDIASAFELACQSEAHGIAINIVAPETISIKELAELVVHRYPTEHKAFYMKNDPDDRRVALCMDVLAPEGNGEIIGGGQREDDLEVLRQKLEAHNLPHAAFSWYLDLRRYGSVPHAGFGMGIERLVSWLCGLPHVREAIPFPRMLERVTP